MAPPGGRRRGLCGVGLCSLAAALAPGQLALVGRRPCPPATAKGLRAEAGGSGASRYLLASKTVATTKLAGAIVGELKDRDEIVVSGVGKEAIKQALSAVIRANRYF